MSRLAIETLAPDAPEVALVSRWRHEAFFADEQNFEESDGSLRAWLDSREPWERMLLARLDARPVGTCWLIAQELDARHDLAPWLAVLYVVPEARGRGVGRALVEAIEAAAQDAGFPRLHLYTHGAEAFYARLGWQTLDRFDDEGMPACLMTFSL